MYRKSDDKIGEVDQAAIAALEAKNRATEELIKELSRQLLEGQRVVEDLKKGLLNPKRDQGDEPSHNMSDTRDLIRLQILGFVDLLEDDKKLKEDAKRDANLIGRLKGAINVVLDDSAFAEMMRSLSSALSHSKADSDCSDKYKKLKDWVLNNCKSYEEINRQRKKSIEEINHQQKKPTSRQSIQQSIDRVTYALANSRAIKEYLGQDKFPYLINVMRGCVSEDDIDNKLSMVVKIFPKIHSQIADIARKNLELYRVEGLPAQESSLAEKNEPPQKENKSTPNLFQPPPRPDTPLPQRAKSDDSGNHHPQREVPHTPKK